MDLFLLKFPVQDLEKIESLRQLRERLLTLLLQAAFVLATVLYVIALIPVYQKGLSIPPLIYTVLYIWLALAAFVKRIPYTIRAGSWAIFFYLLGVDNLAFSGLNVDSGLFFLSYVLMSGLFFDLKQGMIALGICAGSIVLFGYVVVFGLLELGLALPQTDPLLWTIGGIIFVGTGLLLILPLSVLMRGLVGYLEKAKEESGELKNANQALRLSEERYRSLVEISPDLITLIDLDGKDILINQPGLALFGYGLEDLVDSDYLMFIAPEDRPRITEVFQRTLEVGFARDVVCQCVRKDGTLFEAEFSTSLIRKENGDPEAVIAIGKDVTERRNVERVLQSAKEELETKVVERTAELHSASERLKELVTRSPAIIYASGIEKDSPITFVSENVRDYLGYSPEQFIADPLFWKSCLHPQDTVDYSKWSAGIHENGEGVVEYRVRHKNGDYRWIRDSSRIVLSPEGQPLEVVGTCIDITEQKQAEESYRILVDNSIQGIIVFQDGRIIYSNRSIVDSLGFELEELRLLTLEQIINYLHPDDRATLWNRYQSRVGGRFRPGHFELRVFHKNGEIRYLDVSTVPINYGGKPALQITAMDLTERKKMERALRESEEIARVILNATSESLLLVDPSEIVLAGNQIAAKRIGRQLDKLVGVSLRDLFPEEIARSRSARFASVLETGGHLNFEDANNGVVYDINLFPVFDDHGQVARVVMSARDVTERKKMEQDLHESEETWRIMMNSTPSALAMVDPEGRLLAANGTMAKSLGKKLEEILGRIASEFLPEETARSRKEKLDEVIRAGKSIIFEDYRAGRWFENHFHPIMNESGQVMRVVVVARDMTERKLLEHSLQADKDYLEARVAERTWELTESREQLRALTTDVVNAQEEERRRISRELHDEAGQALVSMKYSLESILADLPGKEQPIKKRLSSAIHQLDETMDEIRLLAHSLRPPLLDIADLDLTLKDYCREFGESTKLQVDYTGEPIPSLTDLAELAFFRFLQEALTNVVKHSRATRVRVRLKKRGRYLSLLVVDNGTGKKGAMIQGQGHLGMRERFRILNGQVRIRSASGAGFMIATRIPYLMEMEDDEQDT
jgi:PAS domain S-box-containing protein